MNPIADGAVFRAVRRRGSAADAIRNDDTEVMS